MIAQFALFALFWCCQGTNSLTLTACDNQFDEIDCNSDLITITSATFKEVNDCLSEAAVVPPCNSSTAIDVVKTACEYRSYCGLWASDVSFGTTCSGKMLLSVSYSCVSGLLGDRYPAPRLVTKSSVQLEWQKHDQEDDKTRYVVEKRYIPASQPSAIAGLSFEGFGYIKFDATPFDGGTSFVTKLSFRTYVPDGLLFVAFKSDWSSYAYLQLLNGNLKFSVRGVEGSSDVTTTVALNDGQFHAVQAEKKAQTKNGLVLTVDTTPVSRNLPGKLKSINVNVDSVYVGGISSDHVVEASGVLSHIEPFIGCMQIDQLDNDKTFDLSKKQSYENVRASSNGCPPAVNKGMHFRGTGYAKLTLSSSSSIQLQISFRLRTSWPNGLLLAAYSNDKNCFLFIESRTDGLALRYRKGDQPGDGPFLVRVRPKDASLCDGAWHTINMTMDTTFLLVTVDGVSRSTSSEITDVLTYSSKILENFYLGGMEQKGASPTMNEVALGYGVNVTSYGGCLADLEVNGQLVDVPKLRSASLNVSFAGCPDFTWNGPTCQDQIVRVGTKGKSEETLTDTSGVEAFSEYLYRVSVESGSGALVPSNWIVVRSGEDASSNGPLPELEYDGTKGKGTFRWTGPPAIVETDSSYHIEYSEIYPGTAVQSSALTFISVQAVSLPYTSDVAALTAYTFSITATLVQGSVTVASGYANVTTKGRECVRSLYNGTYYRGTTAVSADGSSCLNWSELSTYSNLVALYPEAGLGNHSYCRSPIPEHRTKPWCYTNDTGGCLYWAYCNIDVCEDLKCYSTVDNGYGYRGSSTDENGICVSWTQFSTFLVSQYAAAGLGDHMYCRNPDPQRRSKPWCYGSVGEIIDCSMRECTSDFPSITHVCEGNSGAGQNKCIFPFIYNGSRFFECTSFDKGIPWCSTKNDVNGNMEMWSYCLCPKPSSSASQTSFSPPNDGGRIDGTCPLVSPTAPPTTLAPSSLASTDASTAVSTTASATTMSSTTTISFTTAIPPTTSSSSTSTVSTVTNTGAVSTEKAVTSNAATTAFPTTSATATAGATANTVAATPVTSTNESVTGISSSSASSTGFPSKTPTSSSSSTPSRSRTPTSQSSVSPKTTPFLRTTLPTGEKSSPSQLRASETSGASLASTPTSTPAQAANTGVSSFVYIGAGVGGGLLAIAIAIVVFACRRGNGKSSKAKETAIEMEIPPSSWTVVSPFGEEDFASDNYNDSSMFHTLSKPNAGFFLPVITEPKIAEIHTNRELEEESQYEAPVSVLRSQPRPLPEPPTRPAYNEDIYWEPAKREEALYEQLSGGKFRVLERSSIELQELLGTGQFGTVEKGMWTPVNLSPVAVAVKTLKSESNENKVQFLREAAIMGQFHHRNVVVMHGVVLTGKPLMVVLEMLPKGDLKQYLQSIACEETLSLDLSTQFLQMARDIAAGMEYLAKRCFIHRDLAARNILLDEKLVCKVSDFGLSRDLADDSYYVTQGGQIPIRWTAPEAISFRKYSTASDVWSYGIVLYEIWTVGKRPYGQMRNNVVVDLLETGQRLPPPPGCSYEIYKLMIECWDPEHRQRPSFNAIATRLSQPDHVLLVNSKNTEPILGKLGDKLELSPSQSAYQTLQAVYKDLNDYSFISY